MQLPYSLQDDTLPHIDEGAPLPEMAAACLWEMHAVLAKYGCLGRFGISLLRQHVPIQEDEILVECVDAAQRALTTKPVKKTALEERDGRQPHWQRATHTVLAGQIAVVTGASSGIGKAIAQSLAGQGVTLGLVGRRLEALQAVVKSIPTAPQRVQCYRADLTVDEDVRQLCRQLPHDFGHIDLLIHSAGVIANAPLEAAPVEDFDRQYRTNVRAPYLLTQALLPLLKARQGQIVFINSSMGWRADVNVSQYAASKHALRAIVDSLRAEVNQVGVRVLSVFPGRTATPMQAAVHQMEDRAYRPERLIQPEDVAMVVLNTLSVPRTAEVTDIHLRPMIKWS